MRPKLPALLAVCAIAGSLWFAWSYWPAPRPVKSIRVILCDSDVNPHPSPKDSSWGINDLKTAARVGAIIRGARRVEPDLRLSIAASGCLEMTDEGGKTERVWVMKTRRADGLSLKTANFRMFIVVEDNDALLRELEQAGVPMDGFFFHDPPSP